MEPHDSEYPRPRLHRQIAQGLTRWRNLQVWWSAYAANFQGSSSDRPHPSKSPTLRVTSLSPWYSAIAAICASNCEIGRPTARRFETISTKCGTAAVSNGRTRPANSSANICATAISNARRRLPPGSKRAPKRISASVTAVTKRLLAGCAEIHATTAGLGAARSNSESTFVSSNVLTGGGSISMRPPWARRVGASPGCPRACQSNGWVRGRRLEASRLPVSRSGVVCFQPDWSTLSPIHSAPHEGSGVPLPPSTGHEWRLGPASGL